MRKKSRPFKKQKYTEPLTYFSEIEIKEEFRKVYIENYGYITINNLGTKVYTKTGKVPALRTDEFGYLCFQICAKNDGNKKYHCLRIHRLVAIAFLPNPDNLPEVNHKSGKKLNNCVTNLEWCTGEYNLKHAWENGLIYGLKGESNGRSKLNEENVKAIREKYTGKRGQITKLAKEYNVSWSLVKMVITNKIWTHVI